MEFVQSVETTYDHRVNVDLDMSHMKKPCTWSHLPTLLEVIVLLSNYMSMWWDLFSMEFRVWTKKQKLTAILTDGTSYRSYRSPASRTRSTHVFNVSYLGSH